ncbi:MAG: ribosome recycling factor [Deltaproteobacteria bacterium]|nr:ribosome recycling factor [Deltaproteobacteria bacterium]
MIEAIGQEAQTEMEKGLKNLGHELSKVRTGRASLTLLDDIRVEAYGQMMPLTHVATLNIPEPRTITIQPWDASVIPHIERAIQAAQLGLSPANDGKIIRLSIPALTEERRKELVKVVHRLAEEARIAIRKVRREANETIKKSEKEAHLSEDEIKRIQQEIQKLTDQHIAKVDESVVHKEKEVMTV